MISIKRLFEVGENTSIPKKYRERAQKKCDYFEGFESALPEMSFPEVGTSRFREDLDEVRRCVRNPSLSKKFLKKSHLKSQDIYKKFLKDEDVDWEELDKILDEFDGITTRLKLKYDRKRPFKYFEERGEDLKTEKSGSASFPSSHTAFAYLICDYLSDLLPEKKRSLEKIAELIGQSRIENGVHFPTDVQAGRYIGEQAAKFLKDKKSSNLREIIINRDLQKIFVKYLREKAHECRPKFKKQEALNYFAYDMSMFISECTGLSQKLTLEASKNFLYGYFLNECSSNKEIINFLEGLCFSYFSEEKSLSNLTKLNSILEENTSIRSRDILSYSGVTYAKVEKISEYVNKIDKFNKKPFLKMAMLNWVAPFQSGNKKITRLILLKETGYNFDITNQILSEDFEKILDRFYLENDIEKLIL